MKSFTFICLLAVISVVYCRTYKVNVNLGGKWFESIDGSLKLKIHGPNSKDTFRMVKSILRPSGHYQNEVEINYKLEDIETVQFYWTLTNPGNPRWVFKKPIIYIDSVTLKDRGALEAPFSKTFKPGNPNQALKPKQEIYLTEDEDEDF